MLRRGGRTIRVDRKHPRIPRLVQELQDAPHGPRGLPRQVLVAHFEISARRLAPTHARLDRRAPIACRLGGGELSPIRAVLLRTVADGTVGVAWITDHVHELSLGEQAEQVVDVDDVRRRLFRPALFPLGQLEACEDVVDQRRERAVDRLRTGAIAPDRVGPLVRQPVVPIEKPLREVALAATRDMWVTIEHDAQQRGARAALTADEHWRARIRWQQYVASDG